MESVPKKQGMLMQVKYVQNVIQNSAMIVQVSATCTKEANTEKIQKHAPIAGMIISLNNHLITY